MSGASVSVVLCTYNGERHIAEQLDSLINQTYKPFEIIIQDDNSTDSTLRILSEYAEKYPDIQVYRNTHNLGFNKNFEKAVSVASGDYIAICDQDDIWYEHKIERLINHIGNHWLIFSNSELIDSNGISLNNKLIRPLNLAGFDYRVILMENFVSGHTVLFKREFRDYILPFPLTGYYDWWIGFIAFYHQKLVYLDEVLTKYRVHSESVINKQVNQVSASSLKRINHKSTLIMLGHFHDYLQDDKGIVTVNKLISFYKKKVSGRYDCALFWFFYVNYNHLFPFEKRRNVLSKTRFKFIRNFIHETIMFRHN